MRIPNAVPSVGLLFLPNSASLSAASSCPSPQQKAPETATLSIHSQDQLLHPSDVVHVPSTFATEAVRPTLPATSGHPGDEIGSLAKADPQICEEGTVASRPRRVAAKSTRPRINRGIVHREDDFLYCDELDRVKASSMKPSGGEKKSRKRRNATDSSHSTDTTGVYCICKGIDDGVRPMVQCDWCHDWFHFACLGLTPVMPRETTSRRRTFRGSTSVRFAARREELR